MFMFPMQLVTMVTVPFQFCVTIITNLFQSGVMVVTVPFQMHVGKCSSLLMLVTIVITPFYWPALPWLLVCFRRVLQ